MTVHWQGWGVWVGLLFVFWFLAVIAFVIGSSLYIPDSREAEMAVQTGAAVVFALYAASVQAVVEIRRRSPKTVAGKGGAAVPALARDEFVFVPLAYWPAILAAIAMGLAVATWRGYFVFGAEWPDKIFSVTRWL